MLTLLRVVLSAWHCPHFLWWRCDEKKTWVAFWSLFVVFHVSPLSLSHRLSSVVRVGGLVLRSRRLVSESASWAVLVSGRTRTTSSASGVSSSSSATSSSSPVCGADSWEVGSFRHHLSQNDIHFRRRRSGTTTKSKAKSEQFNSLKGQFRPLCVANLCLYDPYTVWNLHVLIGIQ